MPHFGVIHAQFSSPENCMTWSRLRGYAANTDSRRELTQKYQQRRCFQDNQAISRRCFQHVLLLSIFAKIDPVKSLVTQGHVKVILRSHLHWLTLYLTEVRNVCIFAGLSDCLAKGTQKIWIHVFLFYCKMSSYKRVVNWGAFSTYGRARDQMYMWIFGRIFACLLSCLARNVNLWKIKFMGLTNCQ